MSKRRFEMFQFRQVLARMRQSDSDRDIARDGLMGRTKCARVRAVAGILAIVIAVGIVASFVAKRRSA